MALPTILRDHSAPLIVARHHPRYKLSFRSFGLGKPPPPPRAGVVLGKQVARPRGPRFPRRSLPPPCQRARPGADARLLPATC